MLAVLIAFAFGFGVGYLLARRSSGTPAVGRLEVKVDGVLLPERKHSMAEFKFTADQIDAAVDKQVDGTIVLKDTAGRIDAIDPAGSSLEMTHSFPFEPTFTKADDFSTFAFKFPVDGDGKAVAGSALISGKVLEDGGTAPDDEHLISVTLIVEINATGAEVAVGPLHSIWSAPGLITPGVWPGESDGAGSASRRRRIPRRLLSKNEGDGR